MPSAAAVEGIRLLMSGNSALKYGRAGKPHLTEFTLSSDKQQLSWKSKARTSLGAKDQRKVELRYVAHFLVGRESAVFKRFQQTGKQGGRLSSGPSFSDWDEGSVLEDEQEQRAAKRAPGKEHLSLSLQFQRGAWALGQHGPAECC